jgi:hypothetical protein
MTTKKEIKTQLSLLKSQQDEITKLSKLSSLESLKVVEDKLLHDNMEILSSVMDFAKISFGPDGQVDETNIPNEWAHLSDAEIKRKLRLAQAGWMNSSEIPHAIKMAHSTVIGVIKARAHENSGDKTLNIENISFPAPQMEPVKYDDKDIIDSED